VNKIGVKVKKREKKEKKLKKSLAKAK